MAINAFVSPIVTVRHVATMAAPAVVAVAAARTLALPTSASVSRTATVSSAELMVAAAPAAVAAARTLASTISAFVSRTATESSAAAMDAERIAGFVVRELSAKKGSVRQLAQSRFAHLYPLAAWV